MKRLLLLGLAVLYCVLLGPSWWFMAFRRSSEIEVANRAIQESLSLHGLSGERTITWDRQEAIKFAFTSTSKTIDYLFVAAIGVIAFVTKTMILDNKKGEVGDGVGEKSAVEQWCIVFALLGLVMSAISGLLAYSYFPKLATLADFSLYWEVAILSMGQQVSFVVALIVFAVVIVRRVFA